MRGEIVIVRAWRGRPFIRRIWGVGENVVLITNDADFQLLNSGDPRAIGPIGVPKEDVFKYDPNISKEINDLSCKEHFSWDKLEPWTA